MTKVTKIGIILCLLSTLTLLLFLGYPPEKETGEVEAQAELFTTPNPLASVIVSPGAIICTEPIPIGEMFAENKKVLDYVFQQYKNSAGALNSAIKVLSNIVAKLSESEDVCDFSKCQAQVVNVGPEVGLKAFGKSVLSSRVPMCIEKPCVGSPCADLSGDIEELKAIKKAFAAASENIKNMFEDEKFPLRYDLVKPTEENQANKKVSLFEIAQRKIDLTRSWFTPSVGKPSCVLTEIERKRGIKRFPLRCQEALEEGFYWPKAWSKECNKQCENGLTQECQDCLKCANCSEDEKQKIEKYGSFLARFNYKLYGVCANACSSKTNSPECFSCLCDGMSQQDCLDFICGGDDGASQNFVCCYQVPETGEVK